MRDLETSPAPPAPPAGQAAGLREMTALKPVRVIAVTGGKGGVGKTSVSLNLAVALAGQGRRVMLFDADLGLANVDVLLGLRPRLNLSHVLAGTASLEEIVLDGPAGLRIVPSASGLRRMASLSAGEHAGIIDAFGELGLGLDTLVVDTAAGLSEAVLAFTRASQEIIVVLCDEPASLTDAYAIIKLLHREYRRDRFRILPNLCRSVAHGRELYGKLLRVCDRYLDVSLDLAGAIPDDDYLRRSIQHQRPVVDAFPRSKSALAFKKLAESADRWPIPGQASGGLEFFVEQLIHAGGKGEEVPA